MANLCFSRCGSIEQAKLKKKKQQQQQTTTTLFIYLHLGGVQIKINGLH